MNTFFTSDLHYNHINILEYCKRPFKSLDEMNDHITNIWNNTVFNNDKIIVIGDFAMGQKILHKGFVQKLNGYKILVSGNHDLSFIDHKKYKEGIIKLLDQGWNEVYSHTLNYVLSNGQQVLLSHLPPITTDNIDMRYVKYKPESNGQLILHGHLHGRYIKKDKNIDVGWDAHNGKILNEKDVINIINDEREYIPSHLSEFFKNSQ